MHSQLDKPSLVHRYSKDGVGYYSRAGKGATAIVLIHGMGGSSHNWRLVAPLLPAEAPLVIIDLPWCATSKKYRGRPDPDGLMDAVASCVTETWTGPIVVAAHSIGGFFAWYFKDQQQVTVKGLALVSGQLFSIDSLLKNLLSFKSLPLRVSLVDAVARAMIPPNR